MNKQMFAVLKRVNLLALLLYLCATTSTFAAHKRNTPPVLPAQSDRMIAALATLSVTNTASDSDTPPQTLSYQLLSPPAGAAISSKGVITWTPSLAQALTTNTITTVVIDNGSPPLSATNSFLVFVNSANTAPILPAQADTTVAELTTLIVTNTATDNDSPPNTLTYTLLAPPAGATISSSGVITWTPSEAQGPGTNTITTRVTDNGTPPLSATNSFTVVVTEVNSAPSLPAQGNRTITALATLVVTNTGTDSDMPANMLSYALLAAPTGATISSAGVISWTPTLAQAPSTNTMTTVVTDNGSPPLSATNSFLVIVNAGNTAPILPAQADTTVAELTTLIVTNTATDNDLPPNILTYTLLAPPAGATISGSGVITWTPTEAQGPNTNTITTRVTDNGTPPLSATNSFTVVVTEVNSAPSLPAQGNQTITALATLVVTNTGSDSDIPANTLSYALLAAPSGATISSAGVIIWTPTLAQAPSTNTITTVVTDSGSPPLSATNSFLVIVYPSNTAPILPAQADTTVAELTTLIVTNTATDNDSPPNTLTYTLLTAPAGATISSSGVITWTPTEAQGPGTNTITTRVTDNGTPPLSATNSFKVVVTEVNSAPSLPAQNNRTIAASSTLVVTNTGTDSDIPANTLTYSLLVAPVGTTISAAGVITWTPSQGQAPSTNTITTQVTDNGIPPLSATNSFIVVVSQTLSPPVITSQPASRTNNAGTTATFSVTATGSSLAYQWIKNSTINLVDAGNISGATTANLTISNVSGSGAGTYTVQITNSAGSALSAPATLTVISNNVGAQLFADDFSRGSDPGPLTPWVAQSGTWTVTGGALVGGTNAAQTSTFAYITSSWTNYSVQARVRFSSINGDGGGIGGRVNPVTGAHYAAWIFPEGSADGPAIMRIFKFQDWFSFEYGNVTYQPLALVNLPSVGTNWHTLKLTFQGNQIGAYYDGIQVAAVTDTESNPYATGAISVDMFTDNNIYNMFVDDVTVNALPPILMAVNDLYFVNRGGNLTVPAPGVLANDTTPLQTNLTAARVTGPFRGTLTLNSNGGFTYVPTNNITGIDTFTYVANDGSGSSAPAVVTIDVTPPTNSFFDDFSRATTANSFSPWVTGLGEWTVTNNTLQGMATIANDYSDAYIPGNWTNFTIQARITLPSGAWAGGLSARVNPATGARYVANIYPEGSPLGPTPALRLIKFHTWNTWSDTFTPMALVNLPSVGTSPHTLRLTVQGNQVIVYFDNNQVVNMVDNNVDGLPAYSSGAAGAHMYMDTPFLATFDDLSITQINLTNTPPVLPAQVNRTMPALTTLLVTNTATDTDIPTQVLTYQLVSPPAGAAISPSGLISWTPNAGQAPSTNLITTIVTDNGTPAMSATNNFTVVVTPANTNGPGQLFTDDFTRGTDPAPISPWIAQSGTWTVTGGSMRAGINTLQTYANAYLTNVWTNIAVQAQIRFPSGGFGGGIGSRVNRTTGAHYAAWVYPEGSPGGPTMLKLVKFQTWTTWSYNGAAYTPMQQVSLPGVGTNWHTLKLGCFGNQISVTYDGTVYINMTDAEATPYLTGGVSADLWTDTVGYNMLVDNVVVTSLVSNSLNSTIPVTPIASAPIIESIVVNDGTALVTWTASPGSVYRLQFKDEVNSPEWVDAEPDIIATDTEASATNSIVGVPQRFYRVLLLP